MLLTWNSLEEISLFKFHFICTLLYLPHLFHHLSYWLISLQLALLFFTLSGNNNWGDTKSNFMRHESPASGRCSDAPAPASSCSTHCAVSLARRIAPAVKQTNTHNSVTCIITWQISGMLMLTHAEKKPAAMAILRTKCYAGPAVSQSGARAHRCAYPWWPFSLLQNTDLL